MSPLGLVLHGRLVPCALLFEQEVEPGADRRQAAQARQLADQLPHDLPPHLARQAPGRLSVEAHGDHLQVRTQALQSIGHRGFKPGRRHISERSEEVEGRKRIGHWEGDTVIGADKHPCLFSLVERKTGFAVVKKLSSRSVAENNEAAMVAISEHRGHVKTITFDNGTEFHDYQVLEQVHPVKCYFATPYHSWERGSNENFNGLLRQYFPKGMCLSKVTQAECDEVARQLNMRPRKRLGFDTPHSGYYRI